MIFLYYKCNNCHLDMKEPYCRVIIQMMGGEVDKINKKLYLCSSCQKKFMNFIHLHPSD